MDTVFVVDAQTKWVKAGVTVPKRFAHNQASSSGIAWERHLRHGLRAPDERGHVGTFTYVARLDGWSYMPLTKQGLPTSVSADLLGDLPAKLRSALPAGRSSYPIELLPDEADTLDHAIRTASSQLIIRVVSGGPTSFPSVPLPPFQGLES